MKELERLIINGEYANALKEIEKDFSSFECLYDKTKTIFFENISIDLLIQLLNSESFLVNEETLFNIIMIRKEEEKVELFERYYHIFHSPSVIGEFIALLSDENKIKMLEKYGNDLDSASLTYILKSIKSEASIRYIVLYGSKISDDDFEEILRSGFSIVLLNFFEDYCDKLSNKRVKLAFKRIKTDLNFEEFFKTEKGKKVENILLEGIPLNEEHLVIMIEKYGYEILGYIDNNNIQQIINLPEEEFNKFLILFEHNPLTKRKFYDLIEPLIQLSFGINNPEVVGTYSTVKMMIENKKELPEENMDGFISLINFVNLFNLINKEDTESQIWKKYLESLGIRSPEELSQNIRKIIKDIYNALLHPELNSTFSNGDYYSLMHVVVNNAIEGKRKDYIETMMKTSKILKLSCIRLRYEKNELRRKIIEQLHEEEMRDILLKIDLSKFNIDSEMAMKCFMYLKNPNQFTDEEEQISIKKKLRDFNFIMDSVANELKRKYHLYPAQMVNGVEFEFRRPNLYIAGVFSGLDVENLRVLMSNSELFEELRAFLKKYSMLEWAENFRPIDKMVGVDYNLETVSNYVNYYMQLRKKLAGLPITQSMIIVSSIPFEGEKILLGEEDFWLYAKNPSPNSSPLSNSERMKTLRNRIKESYSRKYITVPPIKEEVSISSGKKLFVSLGNITEPINFTYGERTGSCMREGGAGEDLYKFCIEDENGFHIRFEDSEHHFISRVSGFRNGNTVFLNELRDSLSENYSRKDLTEFIQVVARMIVERTKDSEYPIHNVVISDEYAMKASGKECTPLKIGTPKKGFDSSLYCDINDSNAIVLASSDPRQELVPIETGPEKSVRYRLARKSIEEVFDSNEITSKIERIHMIDMIMSKDDLESIQSLLDSSTIPTDLVYLIYGEDWYVCVDSEGNIKSHIIKNAANYDLAMKEYEEAIRYVEEKYKVGGKYL